MKLFSSSSSSPRSSRLSLSCCSSQCKVDRINNVPYWVYAHFIKYTNYWFLLCIKCVASNMYDECLSFAILWPLYKYTFCTFLSHESIGLTAVAVVTHHQPRNNNNSSSSSSTMFYLLWIRPWSRQTCYNWLVSHNKKGNSSRGFSTALYHLSYTAVNQPTFVPFVTDWRTLLSTLSREREREKRKEACIRDWTKRTNAGRES